ncbi:MAG TPA: NADH-quinone oxidoreductase subunit L [Chloroflexota bacterium]|nr:NADH-quinone oxidoreductase subunit L [Chloroflexota bacterium]
MVENVWLALLLPLLGFLWCVAFGKLWPRLSGWIATLMVALAFVAAVSTLVGILQLPPDDRIRVGDLYTWISSGAVAIPVGIYLDPLSVVMTLVVTGVSALIHLYAIGYMEDDPRYGRFFAYMNLFVFSMVLLVLAGNYLLLMVGWAGVGLCSYLLIAFWFEKPEAGPAGVKAFVVNAIGDAGLILAASLILINAKSLDYVNVFTAASKTFVKGDPTVTWITLLLVLAAVAKSAQLPLYVWLPDAMAGPTPVSALIHAATMVTAGVYLIARSAPLFTLAPLSLSVVAWIGAITALFAATIALSKPNIKRVLAYSTVSQLGYMFLALGVGGFTAGIFHLMTHAFFKALLFLGAGAVIHALHGEEDMRKMGGLAGRIPLTWVTFLVATLAISGVPGLSGFFSKDEIISLAFTSPNGSPILGVIGLVTAGLTAVYMFRLFFLTFHGKSRVDEEVEGHLHVPGAAMAVPLVALGVLSVVGGYVQWPGGGFDSFLDPSFTFYKVAPVTEAGLNPGLTAASIIFALGGIVIAWLIWGRRPQTAEALYRKPTGLRYVLLNDYGVDAFYSRVFVGGARALGRFFGGVFDPKVVDGVVNGLPVLAGGVGEALAAMETGYVRRYAVAILVGAIVILAYMARGGF